MGTKVSGCSEPCTFEGLRSEPAVSESRNGKKQIRAHQAARERGHDRSRGPRQDDADGGDHVGAGGEVRRRGQGLRPDRRGARREGARHHHQHRPRRVRDHQPPLRARRLPRARRLRQEHDHRCGADGRRHPGGVGRRRPDAADARAHPAGAPGGRALHHRVPEQVRHGRRRRAARSSSRWKCASCWTSTSSRATPPPSSTARAKLAMEGDKGELGERPS